MRKVLITGAGSYVGTKIETWLRRTPGSYQVTVLDMVQESWKKFDFHGYDSVCHVAGIVHRKNVPVHLYEEVNHRLAVETAQKAKAAGIKQFIFMSSGAVYCQSDKNHEKIVVDENTEQKPSTLYGISKMRAEQELMKLTEEGEMKLVILRPPTVYGPGAKGNYNALSKISRRTPVFPRINNRRSMIYIDNLCEFVRLVIDGQVEGIFLPQNKDYVNISNLVSIIAKVHGRRVILTPVFNWVIYLISDKMNVINKVFGTYIYAPKKVYFNNSYCVCDFHESIQKTERAALQKDSCRQTK